MEKLGIEQSLAVLSAVGNLANVVENALEDEKISAVEWAKIGIAGFSLGKGVSKIKQLKEEYLDYSEVEKAELIAKFSEKFDIKDDAVEEVIEEVFGALLTLATAFKKEEAV